MSSSFKKYWSIGVAFIAGLGLAWTSWQLAVVPQYPTLIIDPDVPVEHDIYSIGYLPVELTGKSLELGIPVKVCVVPAAYKNFVHNAPEKGMFAPSEEVMRFVQIGSWAIVGVGVMAIIGLVIYKKKRGKL